MRSTLVVLLAATALSTAAAAQIANSPFGAPSTPLSQDELDAIKQESAARKAAAREAAERRAAKKRAAEEAAAAPAPVVEAPVEKAPDSTSAPAPVSTPAVIDAAPAPAGATTDTTTVIQPGVTPLAPPAPAAPAAPVIVPVPAPVVDPLNSAPAPAPTVAPAAPAMPPADPLNPGPAGTESTMQPPSAMESTTAGSGGMR